jgi:FtsP/CotA-like multicopper oxidase with cupredoxin domain
MRKRQILAVALGGMIASGVYGQNQSKWEIDMPVSELTVDPGDTVMFKTTVAKGKVEVNFTPSSPCTQIQVKPTSKTPAPCTISATATPGTYTYAYTVTSSGGTPQLRPQSCSYCTLVVTVPKKKKTPPQQ